MHMGRGLVCGELLLEAVEAIRGDSERPTWQQVTTLYVRWK